MGPGTGAARRSSAIAGSEAVPFRRRPARPNGTDSLTKPARSPAGAPDRNGPGDPGWAWHVADLAYAALIGELETWPKPGLVSPIDSGSHRDMDAEILRCSAVAIRPYFAELVEAGARGAAMGDLRAVGLRAEAAMLRATGGVNAHRGAIFSLGLICAAAGAAGPGTDSAEERAEMVGRLWGDAIARAPTSATSHGGRAARRHGVGGASAEAAAGFPTIRATGLPALRLGRSIAPDDPAAAHVQCFFALLAVLDDTNLLHRGGAAGLTDARTSAAAFLAAGGIGARDWMDRAIGIHRAFVAAGLSPGGCADLLAATLFLAALAVEA